MSQNSQPRFLFEETDNSATESEGTVSGGAAGSPDSRSPTLGIAASGWEAEQG